MHHHCHSYATSGHHGHGRARVRCSATQSQVCPSRPQRRTRSLPYVIYSQSKQEVTALDVAMLLAVSKTAYQEQGSLQKRALFNHWTLKNDDVSRERALRKIARSIHYSVAIVAAFTNCNVYEPLTSNLQGEYTRDSNQYDRSNNSSASAGSLANRTTTATAVPKNLDWFGTYDRGRQRRSLIGFARANGDGSLAATIYDLAVHPEYRQYGVGSKLLRLLTRQLYQKEVYDIGSIVPLEKQHLFENNSFEDDREQSTTLSFVQHHEWLKDGLVSVDCSHQLDWFTPLDKNDIHTISQGSHGLHSWGTQQPDQVLCSHQEEPASQTSNASCITTAQEATMACSVGTLPHTKEQQVISSTNHKHHQQPRWQGQGHADGVLYHNDPLANVPAPATAALQHSKSLQDILANKLQQCLGPQKGD